MSKPEAQWEIERGFKVSAYDIADASAVRSMWYQAVRAMFEKYDFLILEGKMRERFSGFKHDLPLGAVRLANFSARFTTAQPANRGGREVTQRVASSYP